MTETAAVSAAPVAEPLDHLASFSGLATEFWPALFSGLSALADACAGLVAVRGPDGTWARTVVWPAEGPEAEPSRREALRRAAAEVAEAAAGQGTYAGDMPGEGLHGGGTLLGVRVPGANHATPVMIILRTATRLSSAQSAPRLRLLRHAATLVVVFQERMHSARAREDAARFGAVLDLLASLREEKKFVAAAMRFCNEIAGRYACDRVSLGWSKGDYIRLAAVSHAENFEKRVDAVRRMETAMEEAFDQDEEIVWPPAAENGPIAREHEAFAREQGGRYIASIPLRRGDTPVGVFTCERAVPFSEGDLSHLRIIADRTAAVLADLHDRSRWFGARWAASLKRGAGHLLSPRHTGVKLLAVAGTVALGLFLFLPVPFRVQAPFVVRAQTAAYLPAPFEGYLAEVLAEPGDLVEAGQPLLRLDTRELLLEEAAAIADRERFLRESEKARADNALAVMRIAAAQAEQARVRLELTRHRLSQATLTAPFEGVVIEGDLRERIGAPVRQGDTLMRIARLDALDIEIEIDQRDVHEVSPGAAVRLAFAGRPGLRVNASIDIVEPLAQTRDRSNYFPARCRFDGSPGDWVRPGMTGLGKVEAGRRSPVWTVTRRTADFLRLHLWW